MCAQAPEKVITMRPATPILPTDEEFRTAWLLFLALHDDPSVTAADNLLGWLRGHPKRVRALNEALSLWALAGAAIIASRHEGLEPAKRLQ